MNKSILLDIAMFLLFIVMQVSMISNVEYTYMYPIIWFTPLLLYSVKNPPSWVLLLMAFAIGLLIDAFSNSLGLNCFSAVFVIFYRILLMKTLVNNVKKETISMPVNKLLSDGQLFMYLSTSVLLYHAVYFILEDFSFNNPLLLAIRIALSSAAALIFIYIMLFIIAGYKRK